MPITLHRDFRGRAVDFAQVVLAVLEPRWDEAFHRGRVGMSRKNRKQLQPNFVTI
jgi:hypothetical protein